VFHGDYSIDAHFLNGSIGADAKNTRVLSEESQGSQRLTTVIALQEELPAASYARTVTVLVPTKSGTVADQAVVPEAMPEFPVDTDHFTDATLTLSLAVPLTASDASEVDRIV
jgi:hypothetical protein